MDLADIFANTEEQDRGTWFELVDPVTGEPLGITLLVAGPDSMVQRRSSVRAADELAEAIDDRGHVAAHRREEIVIAALSRAVLSFKITENGQPVPFSHATVVRLIGAAKWVREQVDSFAADRSPYRFAR